MKTLKSIGSVLAGFAAVFILSVATDIILEKAGVFPPQNEPNAYVWWMLLLALVYRSLYAAVGGFVTASLAPSQPLRHAVILGITGLVFASIGLVVNWNKSLSNAWYPILLAILSLPSVWLGGKFESQVRKRKSVG